MQARCYIGQKENVNYYHTMMTVTALCPSLTAMYVHIDPKKHPEEAGPAVKCDWFIGTSLVISVVPTLGRISGATFC